MYNINVKIRGCKDINDLGSFIKTNDINLVLFGEYHGFFNQVLVQKKIIQSVKPDFFLYEMLEEHKILNDKDAKKFLDKPDKEDFSFVSTYGQLKPIVRIARSFNLPIIGCDIKNMGVGKNWSKLSHKERIATFSHEEANKITRKRELRQAKVINEYTRNGLVFGLLGAHHVRKGSLIFSKLNAKKIIVVKPAFKWSKKHDDKRFNSSDISYTARLINLD